MNYLVLLIFNFLIILDGFSSENCRSVVNENIPPGRFGQRVYKIVCGDDPNNPLGLPSLSLEFKIGGERYLFKDKEQMKLFESKYSRFCLAEKTSSKNCECQKILLDARMRMMQVEISGAKKIKFRRKKYTQSGIIDEYAKLKDKAKNWRNYQKKIKGRKVGKKVCKDHSQYSLKDCPRKLRKKEK